MGAQTLVDRLSNLFDRQIAFYDELLRDQQTLNQRLDADDLTNMTVLEQHRASEMNALQQEQALLMREWAEAKPTTGEREAVRKKMADAMVRAEKLMECYETAILEVERRKSAVAAQQADLQRGRTLLDRYRPTDTSAPDSLDSQA
ncbi:MAG: hypothetical protein AMXMBFR84_45290 [Candidatus Hydrogenedentota bacterium]